MAAEGARAGDAGDSIFQQIHDRDVRPWLDLVDELRAHGISQDLPLPQIAVMGDQSCGKSSVLEVLCMSCHRRQIRTQPAVTDAFWQGFVLGLCVGSEETR